MTADRLALLPALFAVVIVGLLLTVLAFQIVADHQGVRAKAEARLRYLIFTLARQSEQGIADVDLILKSVVRWVPMDDICDPARQDFVRGELIKRRDAVLGVYEFSILDADGQLLHSSAEDPPDPGLFANSEGVRRQRTAAGDVLFIGVPRRGSLGSAIGKPIIEISRSIRDRTGQVVGIVVASVALEHLWSFDPARSVGKDGVFALYRGDGAVLIRQPARAAGGAGADSLFEHFGPLADEGISHDYRGGDNIERLAAYRKLTVPDVVVMVGLSKAEIFSGWQRRSLIAIAVTVALTVIIACLAFVIFRLLRRRFQEREEFAAGLTKLAAASTELIGIRRMDRLLARVPELACELLPGHQARINLSADDLCPTDATTPGRLAVPLVGRDGATLGLIHIEHRAGAFTAQDRVMLMQLGHIAAVTIENINLLQAKTAAQQSAEAARQEIEHIFATISDAFCLLDHEWRFSYLNRHAETLLRRDKADLIGRVCWGEFPELMATALYREYRTWAKDCPISLEFYFEPYSKWYEVRGFPHEQGVAVYFRDVTERIETEAQLRQAQKMEIVGQLTGGVAHDFNNLLTVILGNLDLLVAALGAEHPLHMTAEMAQSAAERSAELVHRLVAFARRQPLAPQTVEVNRLLTEFEGLLRRTLGDHIAIEVVYAADLGSALVDPSQLENAILNLAVNARDAMADGGRLTIATANVSLDAAAVQGEDARPGPYIMISVTDTGSGMASDVVTRVFEPFFTTKDVGKGSGLGLSMVYGFLNQSGGLIAIESNVGLGTTVKMYLPRADDRAAMAEPRSV